MAEEESILDPTIKKKKKKKKPNFDIDAAFADGNVGDASEKKFNLDELENALPDGTSGKSGATNEAADEAGIEEFNLDMDFSKTKKKKKKKKDIDELVADEEKGKEDEKDLENESQKWHGTDRDYTYEELLTRVFDIMRDKNPEMVAGKKAKFVMRPPQVVRIGTKKTSFANFADICRTLHRVPKHLLDFLLSELGTSGSVDINSQLIIKGRFQQKQIENVLRRYIKEYVTCHTCRSPDTILQKDTRLFFLQCETCGSRCSVASIKSGFQAVTGKRAAIRAKTT
uniref:Eukaryotic translation initiation factor 2 subunit 2 n=1 Tax=Riptortus pedestris TaxID=329032 RepID=R4WS32_RIPPE|nr:eukaryotic translation initiation factor [Riptortus pedestris]